MVGKTAGTGEGSGTNQDYKEPQHSLWPHAEGEKKPLLLKNALNETVILMY